MREKLRQFMIGRYGTDGLNQFLSITSLVLLLIAIISRVNLFTYLGAALLIFCYYRTFSRNISKRTEENYKFYTLKDRVDNKFKGWKEQWANRKVYHYYRLPPRAASSCAWPRRARQDQHHLPKCGISSSKRVDAQCSDMLRFTVRAWQTPRWTATRLTTAGCAGRWAAATDAPDSWH